MRPIKFRGKVHQNLDYVYGDLLQRYGKVFIGEQGDKFPAEIWEVLPESVAQFVGYDADGKEIYSDDKILSPNGLISEVSAMLLNSEDLQNFELVEK